MMIAKSISFSILFIIIISADAAIFTIRNNCPITVWAAAVPVGGGRRLGLDQSWTIEVAAGSGTTQGRIWARTGCSFDGAGRGRCRTGDCDGLLQCRGYGVAPCTLAEFGLNQNNGLDLFDISVVDGFNVPIEMSPENPRSCSQVIRCVADINGQCPAELRAPAGGCNNPCTVFRTNDYCCDNYPATCGPTDFSRFFKERCPDAYSYPQDDTTSTFTCPGGANYRVVFCP